VAYVVGDERADLVQAMRAQAAKKLPTHMIPQQFVLLEHFPLSPNGKVDRKALPTPQSESLGVVPAPPHGEFEVWLAGQWGRLLGVESVGRDVNLFDLGGNSIMIASLVGLVREHFGFDVPLVRFFEYPTVVEFARHLLALSADKPASPGTALDEAHDRATRRRSAPRGRPRRPPVP
jgi:acyl carrier protein